ncbi:MAG TPA: putative toxin-antitoxin system toxin component, PIN family [Thermomicrobiales bacterium]|jgi:putative PIN family toxin of toxin-antitoxin system
MRVLIDTNIFISYLLSPPESASTISRLVEAALLGEFTLLLPEELLAELAEKLRTSRKLSRRISVDEGQELIDLLRQAAVALPTIVEAIPAVVRDPKDDYLIAQALLGDAGILISRDKDLLSLKQVEQVQILSPFQFVQRYFNDGLR